MAFTKGKSGNPNGRPKGRPDRRTAFRDLFKPHAPALIKKAVDMALEGDTTALRLCIDRIVPALRPRDEPITVPGFKGSLSERGQKVLKGMGAGDITPADAAAVLGALAAQARVQEFDELAERIETLEKTLETQK
jgi:uncharacterized protein with von Willebrand factor type A (vWA) domain